LSDFIVERPTITIATPPSNPTKPVPPAAREAAPQTNPGLVRRGLRKLVRVVHGWFDSHALDAEVREPRVQKSDPLRWMPYLILHGGCLGVFWVGFSWTALAVCVALIGIRCFGVTAFYHRYFSHRTFSTSRFMQFVFAVWANTAAQRGAIWWACQHRQHHQYSDDPPDAHSPVQHGFYWSHFGWLTARDNLALNKRYVKDLLKFPELVFLDRFEQFVPTIVAILVYLLGVFIGNTWPQTGTNGWQMLVWGFFISTVILFHFTCLINSAAHTFGKRRFDTTDDSRNSLLLAILTAGEGWHNNHHRFPGAVRQGFYWWEWDPTYYGLKVFSWLGLIWDLKTVPEAVLEEGRRRDANKLAESTSAVD
jgi:stearoyl-CoA desaturase (delta-9 desaturase)